MRVLESWSPEVRLWLQMQLRPDLVADAKVPGASIGPGAPCNLRCPLCPTAAGAKAFGRAFLRRQILARMLDRLGPQLKSLRLFHGGEPLLNPELHELIAEAAGRSIQVTVHSNFSLPAFDEQSARRLVDSGLWELSVSCDGASQRVYETYRVGGSRALVMRNIRLILEAKRAASAQSPRVIWQFLVHRGNYHEMTRAARQARALGIPILFIPLLFPEPQEERWALPQALRACQRESGASLLDDSFHLDTCIGVWDGPCIFPDGSVLPCCMPTERRWSLGNIFAEPFERIWNKPLIVAMRRYLRSGHRSPRELPCYSCGLDPYRNNFVARSAASAPVKQHAR